MISPADFEHGPATRATTVHPAGPFGGNSQSGLTAQHGTQSGYVMHRRAAKAEHDAAGPEHAAWCAGPSTHVSTCQPCKDAHAAYVRKPKPLPRWHLDDPDPGPDYGPDADRDDTGREERASEAS